MQPRDNFPAVAGHASPRPPLSDGLGLLLLPHNLLAEGGDRDPGALPADHLVIDGPQGEIVSNFSSKDSAQLIPRWTVFQRVLRRVPVGLAVVALRRRLLPYTAVTGRTNANFRIFTLQVISPTFKINPG